MGVPVKLIACGRTHSLAVDEEGRLFSWGSGDDGVLGLGGWRIFRRVRREADVILGLVVVAIGLLHVS